MSRDQKQSGIHFSKPNSMRTEHLKFPLHAEQTIRLPKGCKITGVTVTDDITFLVIENAGTPFSEITMWKHGLTNNEGNYIETEDHKLLCFFEGDYRVSRDEQGNDVKTHIPIPEESATLRKIATFETVDVAATWVLFEEVR